MPADIFATICPDGSALIEAVSPAGGCWLVRQGRPAAKPWIVSGANLLTEASRAHAAGLRVVRPYAEAEELAAA